jgi:hypothetical protein
MGTGRIRRRVSPGAPGGKPPGFASIGRKEGSMIGRIGGSFFKNCTYIFGR